MQHTFARRVLIRARQPVIDQHLATLTAGDALRLWLNASVRLRGLGASVALGSWIVANVRRDPYPRIFKVRWEPGLAEDRFPDVRGYLWTEPETLCATWLRLEGAYALEASQRLGEVGEPPLAARLIGALGKQFLDEVVRLVAPQRREHAQEHTAEDEAHDEQPRQQLAG